MGNRGVARERHPYDNVPGIQVERGCAIFRAIRENFRKEQITPVKTHKLCNGPVFAKAPLASPSLSKILVTPVTSHSIKEIHHADTKNDASRGG